MPGVELKVPVGAVVTGIDGDAVGKLSVTRLKEKRAPFPISHVDFRVGLTRFSIRR